ncbi:MAG: GNAT family N-acetyltransferase [Rhodothermales bacterium]
MFTRTRDGLTLSDDPARLDVAAIHAYLTRSYWAKGIPRAIVERSLRGSLCVGLYDGDAQVGFARVVTDRATFAYLCDVYVLEAYRGRGLGVWLTACVLDHPDLQGLRRWLLTTQDAHGVYEKVGFVRAPFPERFMVIDRPTLYQR